MSSSTIWSKRASKQAPCTIFSSTSLSPRQIANKAYTLGYKKLDRDDKRSKQKYHLRERLLLYNTITKAEEVLNTRTRRTNRRVMAAEDDDDDHHEFSMKHNNNNTCNHHDKSPLKQNIKEEEEEEEQEDQDIPILTPSTSTSTISSISSIYSDNNNNCTFINKNNKPITVQSL
ncbi:uncharacterized protein RHIMIDRAFT_236016 [Rhizopus microsporus ATCC 52813]|uniref:Uncharacterized protein n=1 Tax=Rhizopus microsporus ATCC 52813 TaxID=1340429 RepID=A0A2G4SZ16_RHIZD|nr:uncharacterized protein RHIMIDRAFT_236016 [Rhizopus microsporus ATCC 52813]PHZ14023.1 hypothetical protein RHIMIDRAFT_236016 [Rhizopus microsporus ATCC 52813]